MGAFLMMSGVAQVARTQAEEALRDFISPRSGTFTALAADDSADTVDTVDEEELLLIAESEQGNVTVFYPRGFTAWDDASRHLSATLNTAVFSLHVHDGDLWMYNLFVNGQEADRFNPVPDYWEELPQEELETWSGNAAVVAHNWPGVTAEKIARYLVRWRLDNDDQEGAKAYPDDEYGIGEDWQIVDFMARVGLVYPLDDHGKRLGTGYRFSVPH